MMPRVPGMRNGGIPANLVWDEDNPPVRFSCGRMVEKHTPHCDGSCTSEPITEAECSLINEHREWARIGMNTNNVQRDIFAMYNEVKAIRSLCIDAGIFTLDELDTRFQELALEEMRTIRAQNEEAVKRANLGLGAPKIIGPDGKPL